MDTCSSRTTGLIGDLQTSALVSTEGSIDWFCAPRFDSPSVFGALLDKDKGGYCRIRPTADAFTTKQLYFPDTAVLVTRYSDRGGCRRGDRLHAGDEFACRRNTTGSCG